MTLVETYRGYDIYEVEKKGRKMWRVNNSNVFSLASALIYVDEHINSRGSVEPNYLWMYQGTMGYTDSKQAGVSLYTLTKSMIKLELPFANLTLAEL